MMTRRTRKAKAAASGFAIRVLGRQDVSEKTSSAKSTNRGSVQTNKKTAANKAAPDCRDDAPVIKSRPIPVSRADTTVPTALSDPVVVLTRGSSATTRKKVAVPTCKSQKSAPGGDEGERGIVNSEEVGEKVSSKVVVRVKRRGKVHKPNLKSNSQKNAEEQHLDKVSEIVRTETCKPETTADDDDVKDSSLVETTMAGKVTMSAQDSLPDDQTMSGRTVCHESDDNLVNNVPKLEAVPSLSAADCLSQDGELTVSVDMDRSHHCSQNNYFTNSPQVKVVTPLAGEGGGDNLYAVSVVPSSGLSKSPQEDATSLTSPGQMHTPRPSYKSLISSKRSKDKNARESLSPVDISKIIAAAKRRSEISPTGTPRQPLPPPVIPSEEVGYMPNLPLSYPSECVQERQFFNTVGLIKKSELKLDDPTKSKLHREGGGRLRRVIKPKMAPSMVYKKIQLAKGCVIRGVMNDSDEEGSEYSGVGLREVSPKVSNKSRILALENTRQKKLSPEVHEHYQAVCGRVPVIEIDKIPPKDRLVGQSPVQKKLSFGSVTEKGNFVIGGSKLAASLYHSNLEPLEEALKRSQVELRHAMKQRLLQEKRTLELLTKTSASNVNTKLFDKPARLQQAKVESESLPQRRSSRQRDSKRKEWWHLLRANPDEYEVDSEWVDEQEKLKQRRETRLEKIQAKLREHDLEDEELVEGGDGSEKGQPARKKGKKRPLSKEHMDAENVKKALDKIESMSECSDPKAYADIYDEVVKLTGDTGPTKKVKDWALAKKMLEEAKAWQQMKQAESVASEKRKADDGEESKPKKKKKKKKAKSREASTTSISIVGPDGNVLSKDMSAPLLDKIKPMLNNILRESGDPENLVLRESDIPKDPGKCISTNPLVYVNVLPTSPDQMTSSALRDTDCLAPHMCSVCFINDHDYCDKMKKVMLGQRRYCIHRILCSHYKDSFQGLPRSKLKFLQEVHEAQEMAVIKENVREAAMMKAKTEAPSTGDHLLCDEEMLPAEPCSPDPIPSDMLRRHLVARAEQITRCLGVSELPRYQQSPPSRLPSGDEESEDEEDEWEVADHGAEVTISSMTTCAQPNLVEGVPPLSQSDTDVIKVWPIGVKSKHQKTKAEKKEKSVDRVRVVRITSQKMETEEGAGQNEGTINLHDLSQRGNHKLIKVKVQRIERNRVVLKHSCSKADGTGEDSDGEEETVIREITLPEDMQSMDDLNSDFLNDIIAKEAIKLVGEDALVKSRLLRSEGGEGPALVRMEDSSNESANEDGEADKPLYIKQYDKLTPPSTEEREQEMERTLQSLTHAQKITEHGGDTCQLLVQHAPPSPSTSEPGTTERKLKSVTTSRADEATKLADLELMSCEADTAITTSTITLTMSENKAKRVAPHEGLTKEDDTASTYTLSFTTKDIRERRPRLMNYIKKTNLTSIIHEKLCRESCNLTGLMKDTSFLTAKLKESMHQKSTLLEAIQEEKATWHEKKMPSTNETKTLARRRKQLQRDLMRLKLSRGALSHRLNQHRQLMEEINKLMAPPTPPSDPVIVLCKSDPKTSRAQHSGSVSTAPPVSLTQPVYSAQRSLPSVRPALSALQPAAQPIQLAAQPIQTAAQTIQLATQPAPQPIQPAPQPSSKMIQIPISLANLPGKTTMLSIDPSLLQLSQSVTGKSEGGQQPMLLVQLAPQPARPSNVAQSATPQSGRMQTGSQMLQIRLPKSTAPTAPPVLSPAPSLAGGFIVQPGGVMQATGQTGPVSLLGGVSPQLTQMQFMPVSVGAGASLVQRTSLAPMMLGQTSTGVSTVLQNVHPTPIACTPHSTVTSTSVAGTSYNPVLLPNGQLVLQKLLPTMTSPEPAQSQPPQPTAPHEAALETPPPTVHHIDDDGSTSPDAPLLTTAETFTTDEQVMSEGEVGVIEYIEEVDSGGELGSQAGLLYTAVAEETGGQDDLLHAAMVQCQLDKTTAQQQQPEVKPPASPVHTEVVQTPFSLPPTFSALMDEGCQGFIEVAENRSHEVFSQETNSANQDVVTEQVYTDFDFDV